MIKKIFLVLFLLPSLLFAQIDSIAVRYSKEIDVNNLKKNLTVLASDEYEGRETGQAGQKKAANYIVSQYKETGVNPYNKDQYYQNFILEEKRPNTISISIEEKEYTLNKDFYNFSGDVHIDKKNIKSKEIVFLGYGIEEKNYNDYQENKLKNKTVMILSGEPRNKDSVSLIAGSKTTWSDRTKIKTAKEKGISILLIVKENIENEISKNRNKLESPSVGLEDKEKETTIIFISVEMANDILSKNAITIDKIKSQISQDKKPFETRIKKNIIVQAKELPRQITTENVLGYVEGSDLKNELIVISAHYDHLGIKANKVYNGADDDGSGTVAIMELAKVFSKAKKEGHGPRRSILFVSFAGEEKGLLGSSYYVQHPEFPLANTVCDLNIDMIGRIDEKHEKNADYVYLIGSDKLSSQLHLISENNNKLYTNLELDYRYNDEKDKNRFYYRSDHYNFAKNGIPVIFYFNGVHDDYHQPTDDVEKINFEKIQKISSLVFFTAWDIANRNERIKVDSNKK